MNTSTKEVQIPDRLQTAIMKAITKYDGSINENDIDKCVDAFTYCVINDPSLMENVVKNAINSLHASQNIHSDNNSTLLPFPNVLDSTPCNLAATEEELKSCRPSLNNLNIGTEIGEKLGSIQRNKNKPSLNFATTVERAKGARIYNFKIRLNPRRQAACKRPLRGVAKLKNFYHNLRIIRDKRSSLDKPGPSNQKQDKIEMSGGSNLPASRIKFKVKLPPSETQRLVFDIELYSQFI